MSVLVAVGLAGNRYFRYRHFKCHCLRQAWIDLARSCGIRLGEPLHYIYGLLLPRITVRKSDFKDQEMSHAIKIAIIAAFVAVLGGISGEASARGRLYPLTRCGPDLAYLCPIHGYFDQAPFRYSLAIYPGCIKVVHVETPYGITRQRAIVCG